MKNEKYKFALTDNTTWVGADALNTFYSKALLTGETLSTLSLLSNVKSKMKVGRVELANILRVADCSFTDTGTTTLSQKEIDVTTIAINKEFCLRDFEESYLSLTLRPGKDQIVPDSFAAYVVEKIAENVNADLHFNLWQGAPAASPAVGVTQGLLAKFDADADVVDVSGTTLSATNIIAEMGKLYAAVSNNIADRGKVEFHLSPSAIKFYKQALAALNNALIGSYNNGNFQLSYIDIPVKSAKGMPTNVMVAAETGTNLILATDLLSDMEDVMIIPQRDKSGAPTIRFVAEFKVGFNYYVGTEITYYH